MKSSQPRIEIVSYKPAWVGEFNTLANQIRLELQDLARRIDHIGSTAVPGLAAKDRIDIQLSVSSADNFPAATLALERLGYQEAPEIRQDHLPPGGPFDETEWVKRYFRPPADQRPTNLHVRILGRANQRYALLFRDYLRQHSLMAEAYAELKRKLCLYNGDNIEAYCDIKDPACDIIAISAQTWAQSVVWSPGNSDA